MLRKYLVLMISMILLFGCATQVPDENAKEKTRENEVSESESPINQTINKTIAEDQNEETRPEVIVTDTYSADFVSLTKMNIPLECEITYTYQGREIQAKVFMQGVSRLRVDSPVGMTQCTTTITIIRDKSQYVGCEGKTIMPSCDWFKSSYDPSKPGRTANFDFQPIPSSEISCRDWVFDESKFRTEGTSCKLQ